MGKSNRVGHRAIVLANVSLIESLPKLEFCLANLCDEELARLEKTCWACGDLLEGHTYKAHVIARSKGGPDEPKNYFLLCDPCHDDQPDGLSRDIQETWLREHQTKFEMLLPVVKQFMDQLIADGCREAVEAWIEDKGVKRIVKLLKEGYESTSGWRNGRANAMALVRSDYREFLRKWKKKNRGPETQPTVQVHS